MRKTAKNIANINPRLMFDHNQEFLKFDPAYKT